MKKTFHLLIALTLTAAATASTHHNSALQYDTVPGDLSHTRIYTLKNGLKLYLSVNKEKPRIQTYIAVRTGSKNDPAETTGLAHYLEHIMFKGTQSFGVTNPEAERPLLDQIEQMYEEYRLLKDSTQRRAKYHVIDSLSQQAARYFIPNEYDKLMAIIGSEGSNAYTSTDVTCYTEDIPANQLETWARIQADRMQNMVVRGFHTELEAVYEEYNIHLANDMDKMYNAMYAKLFPNHPYGTQTTIGTQEHLKNPSVTNIKRYYDRWYRPNNVAICMSGDLDPDRVVSVIDRHFGLWRPGSNVSQPVFPPLPPLTQPVDTTVVGQEAERVMLAWRYERAASLEADTMNLLSDMLFNGRAGLIDLNLNGAMQVQQAYCYTDPMQDHSVIFIGGTPKEGQTLEQVRQLLLEQVERLKSGHFSDQLLPSIVNNAKLHYYTSLESNSWRADQQVQAFVNGKPWQQQVSYIDRISGITKQQMVSFAQRHLTQGFVTIYKRQGTDTTQKPVEKPSITPIPTNRDMISPFVKSIQNVQTKAIEPRFVNLERDLQYGKTRRGLDMTVVSDKESGRFQLAYMYDFGTEADPRYSHAADYLKYIGTSKLSRQQVKQQFYRLACDMNVVVEGRRIVVYLTGLAENMDEALRLTEHVLNNAKATEESWNEYVELTEKSRTDAKKQQQSNFTALYLYGVFGQRNPWKNVVSVESLRQTKPEEMTRLLKQLKRQKHTLLYYGPLTTVELDNIVSKRHKTAKRFSPVPANQHYTQQATPHNEVLIAPYDAKNIYMRMIHIEPRPRHEEELGLQALYNEYFGGGMNSVVFQELREARGLAYNAWAHYSQPEFSDQPENFMTHIITQNDKMADCIRQFQHILDTIPASEQAFQVAKESVIKRLQSRRVSRWALINAWVSARDLGISYDQAQLTYEQLASVTLADMLRFANQQTALKTYRYVILGDEKQLDMPFLQQIGSVRRLSTEQIFGY